MLLIKSSICLVSKVAKFEFTRSILYKIGRKHILASSLFRFCSSAPPIATMKLDSPEFRALFTPELIQLSDLFKKHGYELRIAGGAVRDLIMGIKPADVDFATTATPEEMMDLFTKENIRMLHKKGEAHGTVTCRLNDCENFEVTTLRIDKVCYGRKADVEFTTDWYKDACRRDLTINALFLGLDGTVYDYHGGIEDIENRKVAFVGQPEERIQEDYLRILRYFRFYGRISKEPNAHEAHTLRAIRSNAEGMKGITGERIWMELKKIVVGNYADSIMRTMLELGLGPVMGFPETCNTDEFSRVFTALQKFDPKPMTLIPALLDSEEQVYKLDKRLKMSNAERLLGVFICHQRGEKLGTTLNKRAKFYQDLFLDGGGDKEPLNRERVLELAKYMHQFDLLDHLAKWDPPKFPVDGYKVGVAGVKKGPRMREVLKKLFEAWKESNYELNEQQLLDRIKDVDLSKFP